MTGNDKFRILLVEDTLTQAMLFQHLLEKHGFAVTIARSAEKALEQIEVARPDAVLSDINMPEMNGYELSARIKTNHATQDILVVLLTATFTPETIYQCINCHADELVVKGMDEEDFVELLKSSLSRSVEIGEEHEQTLLEASVQQNGSAQQLHLKSKTILRLLLSVWQLTCKLSKE